MSLTIDEAIARFEANAEQNERWANAGLNPEANAEYAAEHRQLAEWLRELKERRKAPEITTGEWIVHLYKVGVNRYECDACHARCDIVYPYCPYCGEKKEGKRYETD